MARLPTQDRSRARVERILAAATAILAEVETPATLRAVAARAAVSPGTVYQFFDNMEALRGAVGERARVLLAEALAAGAPAALAHDPAAFFAAMIDAVDTVQQSHPELGCMARPSLRSAFAEALARELRQLVLAYVAGALSGPSSAEADAPDRLGMAATVLLSLLEQAPARDAPERRAYLQATAFLAATALAPG